MSNPGDRYEPPTKEFIRNSLTYGLLSDGQGQAVPNAQPVDFTRFPGWLPGGLIQFALRNKEKIRRVPILGGVAAAVKRSMMNNAYSGTTPGASELDFSGIMGLGIDDFIGQLYLLALGRPPDAPGLENCRLALNNGAKKEAVVYMICTSKEFADRARVAHLNEYRKAYARYRLRETIKRLPVLGWLWTFAAMPRRFARLAEALLLQSNTLEARVNTLVSEDSEKLQNLSTQIKVLSSQYHALQTQLDIANQNIIKANVKLDETGAAVLNSVQKNRPVIYGLSGGVTVIQTNNYVIGVPSEEWHLAVFLNQYGRFEFGTEDFFRSILREGMNVLDIGANLGIYSLHALAAGCHVYAYEPTPKVFDILIDNIGVNGFEPAGRAHLYRLAVSDTEGEVEFAVYENRNGHNTFYPTDATDKRIQVKTVTLDKHLAHLTHVDVAKIDVEGAEPLVLKGMQGIIANNPGIKIIMEFAPSHLQRAGQAPLDFIRAIRAMGLRIRLIDEESGELREIHDDDLCAVYSANVLLEKSS